MTRRHCCTKVVVVAVEGQEESSVNAYVAVLVVISVDVTGTTSSVVLAGIVVASVVVSVVVVVSVDAIGTMHVVGVCTVAAFVPPLATVSTDVTGTLSVVVVVSTMRRGKSLSLSDGTTSIVGCS